MSKATEYDIQQTMLAGLKRRQAAAEQRGQVDNAQLPAGSPIIFYCKMCGLETARLPESYLYPPAPNCEPCEAMVARGYDPNAKRFG